MEDDSVLEEIKEKCRRDFEKNLNYFFGHYKKNKGELMEKVKKFKKEQTGFDEEAKSIDKKIRQVKSILSNKNCIFFSCKKKPKILKNVNYPWPLLKAKKKSRLKKLSLKWQTWNES